MAKTYGIGVYGIGWVAGEHIKAANSNPNLKVTAIASRRKESAQSEKDKQNLDCDVLNDFDELLKHDEVDIIDICTPNVLHAEQAIKAAEAGKHLIIEKPLGMNLKEIKDVRDAIKKAGVKSQSGLVLRFNPYVQNVYHLVTSGLLGEVFHLEIDYNHEIGPWWSGYNWGSNTKAGGPSATLVAGCHAVDMLPWMLGEVDEVFAYGTFGHRKDYEYEPTYAAVVKFKNGKIGKTGCSFEVESPYVLNFQVHGSKGSIYNEKFYMKETFPGQNGWQKFQTIMPDSGDVAHHSFSHLLNDFADALVNDRKPNVNIDDSYRAHELCLAIDRSIETGEVVKLPLT
jgi:predicted dehydrogenase